MSYFIPFPAFFIVTFYIFNYHLFFLYDVYIMLYIHSSKLFKKILRK